MSYFKISILSLVAILSATICACSKTNNGNDPGTIQEEPDGDYPSGITVTEFTDEMGEGDKCLGFIATVDFSKNPSLKFNVHFSTTPMKPTEIYKEFPQEKGKAEIVINGGYFAGISSVSTAFIDGYAEALGSMSMNWPNDENPAKTVYPVRSSFGIMGNGKFEIDWIYCTYKAWRTFHSYPSALDNDEKTKTFMKEPPTENTPGAEPYKPLQAIGGGPRIVQNGKNVAVENYWAEILDSGGTAGLSRQPRTAIGVTADNRLIMIVCDGRGMRGSCGMTLSELADKFISLGATDAMNLDGGGSSTMVGKDGKVLNRPSDSGNGENIIERKIPTAVVISEIQE